MENYLYGCSNYVVQLNYTQMNDVYAKAGLSKEEFHNAYTLKMNGENVDLTEGSIGTVKKQIRQQELQKLKPTSLNGQLHQIKQ